MQRCYIGYLIVKNCNWIGCVICLIIKINSREFLPEKECHEIFLINTHSSKILLLDYYYYNHLQNLEIEIVEKFFSLKKEFISVIWNKKKIKSIFSNLCNK